jgi:hypothetical protein
VIYEEDLLYTSTWGINAANDYGTEAWLKRQPKWEQERLLGGKNKRILFEAGVLKEIDYSKSLTELKNNGIIIVSKKTVKHSTIGEISDFKNPKKPEQGGGTFKSGGHSQKNIDLLDALQKQYENSVKVKANYEYNIVKEYSNGVRVGHVALHGDKNKRNGIEQTWFPKDWDDEKIHVAGTYVANLKEKYIIKRTVFKHAVYENVEVAVCIDPITKEITTIFPDKIQAHLKE